MVDAATRAVLLEAAALIPGIHVLDAPVDFSGRPGVAVAVDEGTGSQHQLVFDSETGVPIGSRALGVRSDGTGDLVLWESSGYSSAIVGFAP
ncbi:hypothetical protein C5C17_01625 [Pseudoclavibacter sp. RFBA6]|nr:hypothetical protein C5C17_01625 [Pseudoclavibacter sp. RFBA6]